MTIKIGVVGAGSGIFSLNGSSMRTVSFRSLLASSAVEHCPRIHGMNSNGETLCLPSTLLWYTASTGKFNPAIPRPSSFTASKYSGYPSATMAAPIIALCSDDGGSALNWNGYLRGVTTICCPRDISRSRLRPKQCSSPLPYDADVHILSPG